MIIFSCISRGSTILCSHQNGTGNYEQAAATVLTKIPTRNDGKTTVPTNHYKFHCLVENGIVFLCAAKSDFGTGPCFAYLTEVKDQFHNGNLAMRAVSADSHEFDSEFSGVMGKNMEKYSKPGAGSGAGISTLQSQVQEVQGVMAQNIEKVIERGERLDDLMDKTDDLEAASATFQRTASKIKRKYWWRNTKMKLIIAAVVLVIITAIVLAIVFGSGVLNKDDKKTTAAPPPLTSTTRP